MRLLPVSLLSALFASVVIAASDPKLGSTELPGETIENEVDEVESTVFNGATVPPLPAVDGEKFNATVKEGYWFVKHHS